MCSVWLKKATQFLKEETGYMEVCDEASKQEFGNRKLHSGMFMEDHGRSTEKPSDTMRRTESLCTKRRQQNQLQIQLREFEWLGSD
jgi:hypothetical protein